MLQLFHKQPTAHFPHVAYLNLAIEAYCTGWSEEDAPVRSASASPTRLEQRAAAGRRCLSHHQRQPPACHPIHGDHRLRSPWYGEANRDARKAEEGGGWRHRPITSDLDVACLLPCHRALLPERIRVVSTDRDSMPVLVDDLSELIDVPG